MSIVLAAGREALLAEFEREAPTQIAEDTRNCQIVPLSISQFAVEQHVQDILQTLSLETRRDAATSYRSAHVGIEAEAVSA